MNQRELQAEQSAAVCNITMPGAQKAILVTVGTTKFDELIQGVDNEAFLAAAQRKGYTHLWVQKGNGSYQPTLLLEPGGKADGLQIEVFDYKPNLAATISSADLIISHAGSGSIFEGLSNNKPLIVVPNERLMHNHQVELAEQLSSMQHLEYSSPAGLASVLDKMDVSKLKPYKKGSAAKVAAFISQELGFGKAATTAVASNATVQQAQG